MTTITSTSDSNRKPATIFILSLVLLLSFFSPFTRTFWHWIDRQIFYLLNAHIAHSSSMRTFWALANHSLADWIEDLCILGFYLIAIFKAEKHKRSYLAAAFFFSILWLAFTIVLINRLVFRDLLHFKRLSPTLTLSNSIDITEYIDWIRIKATSNKSFPGDHATTAWGFGLSFYYLVRGKLGFFALLYALLLTLPRLCVGAHWFSDAAVGSLSIVLISGVLAFGTPIGERCIQKILQLAGRITKRIKRNYD